MKNLTILSIVASGLSFVFEAHGGVYYTTENLPRYGVATKSVWSDADAGIATSWQDHNDGSSTAVVRHGAAFTGKTVENDQPFLMHGLEIDLPSSAVWVGWWQQKGEPFALGAGGLTVKNGRFFVGNKNPWSTVRLDTDQTWTGSEGTYFSIGTEYETYFGRAKAADGVGALTIAGGLNACFFAPDNDLSDVAVTVRDSAKLWLFDVIDARLNAKKLIFSGDGVRMEFGEPLPTTVFHYPVDKAISPTNIVAIDHAHLACEVVLDAGADLSACGGIYALTNLTVSGVGQSVISGDLTFTQALNRVKFAADGASLEFATKNTAAEGVAVGFAIEGPGTLKVTDMSCITGAVSIGEDARFECVFAGVDAVAPVFSGAGTLIVHGDEDGIVYLPSTSLEAFTGTILFDTGTLVLDEPLAEGRLAMADATLVVADSDQRIVTDTPVTEAMTVSSGETLVVYGNGLKADTPLILSGGTVRFMRSATISSPVTVAESGAILETASADVVGTLAGQLTSISSASAGTQLTGEGAIRFTRGGEFSGKGNGLKSLAGTAIFDGGTYVFKNCGSIGLLDSDSGKQSSYGRKWLVTNGAVLRAEAANDTTGTRIDFEVTGDGWTGNWSFDRISELEVANGGTIELGAHVYLKIGKYFSKGCLRIAAGGVVRQTSSSGNILLGYSTMGWGVVNLAARGLLELAMPLQITYDKSGFGKGQLVWEGGTLKVAGVFPEKEAFLLKYHGTPGTGDAQEWIASLRLATELSGDDCVLDLSDLGLRETPIANVPQNFERAEWFGTGTLTVKGGKTIVMNSFASGGGLALEGDGTTVVLPADVQFHDADKRAATVNASPRATWYKTIPDVLPGLSLKSFVSKGIGVHLVCEKESAMLSVNDVFAHAGGEFANDTFAFPGGLSVANVAFAENAVVGGNGRVPPLSISVNISLASVLGSSVRDGVQPSSFVAFEALGTLDGWPVWTPSGAGRFDPHVSHTSRQIFFTTAATRILIR